MGCFRFLLAVSVMVSHLAFYPSALPHPLPGDVAVEAFYVISGFLITLVLCQKYTGSLCVFYTNRALRIYPIYLVVVALYLIADWLVVAGYVPSPPVWGAPYYKGISALWWWEQSGSRVDGPGIFGVVVANLAIVSQDILTFLNEDGVFHASNLDLFYHKFIIVKVAWTIAIELMFYAVAPFIVREPLIVCIVFGVSFASQLLTYLYLPISPDWFSRIFPFALTFFMAGSIAYRGYVWLIARAKSRAVDAYVLSSCLAILALTISFPYVPLGRVVYLTATAICLPGIVIAGRRIRVDSFLGDLSYPIYLVHPLFMIIIVGGSTGTEIPEALAIAGGLLISVALVYSVERPIDRYRQARVHQGECATTLTVGGSLSGTQL